MTSNAPAEPLAGNSRHQFLAEVLERVSSLMSTSLDYPRTLPEVGRLVVPLFADWCAIDLVREGSSWERAVRHPEDAEKDALHAALASDLALRVAEHAFGVAVSAHSESPSDRQSGDAPTNPWVGDQRHDAQMRTAGVHSVLLYPLSDDGQLLGTMSLFATDAERAPFDENDRLIGQRLASLIGCAIRNARFASELQTELHQGKVTTGEIKKIEADLLERQEELEDEVHERTRAMVETHQRLREMERMATIGTLSAGLGHDMGNLLLPLRLRLDSLNSMNLPALATSDLEAIGTVLEYLQRLATGLRSLAIDPKSDRHANAETRLRTWWRDVENLMRNALPPGVELQSTIPARLPVVRIAPPALTQAVLNIIQNGGHALRGRPGARITVSAEATPDANAVRLRIIDNGPGMDDQSRRHCFEPFYSTKKRQISTGLGLAVVRAIVTGAGGQVSVESSLGAGATFTLVIPVYKRAAASRRTVEPSRQALLSIADPRQRALVASVLRHDGFDVKEGAPRRDAQYRLWITDAASQGTGAELLAFVDDDPRRVAIVVGVREPASAHARIHAFPAATDVPGLRALLKTSARGDDAEPQEVE